MHNLQHVSGKRVRCSFLWVLSEDNLFPRFIRKVDRAGRSPYIGVLTIAISSLIFSQFDFTTIIEMNITLHLGALHVPRLSTEAAEYARTRISCRHVRYRRRQGGASVLGAGFSIATFALCLNPSGASPPWRFLASGVVAYHLQEDLEALPWRPVAYPQDPRTGLAVGDTRRIGLFALIIAGLFVLQSADQPAVFRVGVKATVRAATRLATSENVGRSAAMAAR